MCLSPCVKGLDILMRSAQLNFNQLINCIICANEE